MYEIKMTVLTNEEHKTWKHLCGQVGEREDDQCDTCEKKKDCAASHVLIDVEHMTGDMAFENGVGQIMESARYQTNGRLREIFDDMFKFLETIDHVIQHEGTVKFTKDKKVMIQ